MSSETTGLVIKSDHNNDDTNILHKNEHVDSNLGDNFSIEQCSVEISPVVDEKTDLTGKEFKNFENFENSIMHLSQSARPPANYQLPTNYKKLNKIQKTFPSCIYDGSIPATSPGLHPKNFTFLKKLIILLSAIFLFIPRLLLFIISVLLMNLFSYIGTLGIENRYTTNYCPESPDVLSLWRRIFRWLALACYRIGFVSFGVWWISEKNLENKLQNRKNYKFKDCPIMICAPHVSMCDTAFFGVMPFQTNVSPIAFSGMGPWLNNPMRIILAILVDLQDRKSRNSVLVHLNKRLAPENIDKPWRPIVVFPEATCTSGRALTNFKTGAFTPGKPVQPVYIESSNIMDCSFSWLGLNAGLNLLMLMLSFKTSITIHYLPIYHPNNQEKKDSELFAYNVRQKISNYSKLPILDTDTVDGKIQKRFETFPNYEGADPQYAFIGVIGLQQKYDGLANSDIITAFDRYLTDFEAVINKKTGEILKMSDYQKTAESLEDWPNEFLVSPTGENKVIRICDAVEVFIKYNLDKISNKNK